MTRTEREAKTQALLCVLNAMHHQQRVQRVLDSMGALEPGRERAIGAALAILADAAVQQAAELWAVGKVGAYAAPWTAMMVAGEVAAAARVRLLSRDVELDAVREEVTRIT